MKFTIGLFVMLLTLSSIAVAKPIRYQPVVLSAKVDADRQLLIVVVAQGAGCPRHFYTLDINPCMESYPVQCNAQIFNDAEALCQESTDTQEAVFTFRELRLLDPYFNKAQINIKGGQVVNQNGTRVTSSASIRLPSI